MEKKRIAEEEARKEREKIEAIEAEKRRIAEELERQRIMRQQQYFPATPYTGVSIVDGLKAIDGDSSENYRTQIAARNRIGGYSGTPGENTHMLNLLKQGRLLRP